MKSTLKKLLPLAGVVCCFSSSLLLAATQYGGNSSGNCCPPKKPDPCEPCDEVLDRTRVFAGCDYREITPCAGPRVACGADLFITADFIYWTSRMDGLGYAANGVGLAGPLTTGSGTVKHPDFGWDPGFKVGLGYNLDHDCWDLFAEYTYLRPRDTDSTSTTVATLYPLWAGNFTVLQRAMATARVSWDYDLNVIDLELGRNYFISRYLTLRPHFGLKGTWQDHEYRTRYTALNPNTFDYSRTSIDQDYWGVGLRTGLDTVWYFNKYFGIFGDFALSALWGEFDVHRRDLAATNAGTIVNQTNIRNQFYSLKSVFEIALGLQADFWFSDDSFHLGLNAGWEMQYWPSQNQFLRLLEESAHGDLYFMGLTIGVRFDF